MRLVARWSLAVAASAAGFALAWWVCQELIKLDEGVSLGIAGAALAVVLAVGAWWVSQASNTAGSDDPLQEQAPQVRAKSGDVENTISGGTFSGPVQQARDFTGLTFGASPPTSASEPRNPDAG